MSDKLSDEILRLKEELDEFVLARGWPTEGYYFDDSSLEGFHLTFDPGGFWTLYWEAGGLPNSAERRFIHLQDACRELKLAVIEMNQPLEAPSSPQAVEEELAFDGVDPSELDESEGENDPVFLIMLLLFLLIPFLLVGLPLLIGMQTALTEWFG
jgi:hypothetical protein